MIRKSIVLLALITALPASAQQGQAVGPYISPTAPAFSTSVTSPLIIGGTGTTGTQLTLQTTTGVGTTDAFKFAGGNNGATTFGTLNSVGLGLGAAPSQLFTGSFSSTTLGGSLLQNTNSGGNVAWGTQNDGGVTGEFGVRGSARGAYGTLVANDTYFYGNSATGITYMADNATSVMKWATGGNGLKMQLSAAGGLGIGTTTDPGAGGLQMNAKIFAPNLSTTTAALGAALCWTATTGEFQRDTNAGGCLVSSEQYKHDIAELPSMLDEVMAMKPVSFIYNDEVGISGRQVGFIAEQMASVDKRLVGFNADGSPQSVRYMQMTAVLTGAIQALKADNDHLRSCQRNWRCRILGWEP